MSSSFEEKKAENGIDDGGVASRLARPNILELQPYRCARDDYAEGILLDANENALGSCVGENLHRYPDPHQLELKRKLGAYRGAEPEQIFCGVGSDEAIDLLMRIFCIPGTDNIVITPPTYGMYKVCAKVNNVQLLTCPLTPEFDLRIQETLDVCNEFTKLLFLCSPGNPTCKLIPLDDIKAVATSPRFHGIVVVDEAYVDFAASKSSAVSLISQHDNIVVLQTLSKAFGLAGIRCGFAMGPPDIIRLMNNVKAPYNVNSLTMEMAIQALNHDSISLLQKNISILLQQREHVKEQLERLDFVTRVYPSDSNFLLFRLQKNAKEMYKMVRGLNPKEKCAPSLFFGNANPLRHCLSCHASHVMDRWPIGVS